MTNANIVNKILDTLSDGYDDEEETEVAADRLFQELLDVPDNGFLKAAILRLCERVEELEA